jgi:hypothetical protein
MHGWLSTLQNISLASKTTTKGYHNKGLSLLRMAYDLLNEGYKFLTPTMIDATKIPRSLTRDNLRDT